MKRLILLLLLSATTFTVFSQIPSQVQAKRGVFTEQLYLNGKWINRIATDMNTDDTTSDDVVATAKAVADFIRPKIVTPTTPGFQQVLDAGSTLTKTNIINGGNNLFVWNNNLAGGNLYRLRIDNSNAQVTRTIYGSDFNTISDFIQGISENLLYARGTKMVSQYHQFKDGGQYLSATANYTFTESGIKIDTTKIEFASGSPNANSKQHKIRIAPDSISIGAFTHKFDGTEYIAPANLFLRGLPTSTSRTDSVVVKLPDGRIAFRGPEAAPKVYTALLSQTGANNPVATILGTNSLGAIVWTRNGPGAYTGTLTGAFPGGKTFVIIGNANDYTDNPQYIRTFRSTDNTIEIKMQNGTQQLSDEFNYVSFEIRVYP